MSHQNPDSQLPDPLKPEAHLEASEAQTIDVAAISSDSEAPLIPNPAGNEAIAPPEMPSENDGFLLARKLRQHNRELVKTVMQLEQALAESQERLQNQIKRSRSADSLLDQQADNLTGNQGEIQQLQESLEQAKADLREQRATINELNQALKRNQHQLAQVEQEYATLQQSYDEQHQKLVAAEQEIQDFQVRLQRQQNYTLEYKTALEKQTDPNAPRPKTSRIEPWSEQKAPSRKTLFPHTSPVEAAHNNADIPTAVEPVKSELVSNGAAPSLQEATVILPPDVDEDLDKQLQLLEAEMEAMSQEALKQELPTSNSPSVIQVPQWQTTIRHSTTTPTPSMPQLAAAPQPLTATPAMKNQLPAQQKNWPSPTLNPLRTTKKKKRASLAAVQLPSFNRR